MTVPGKGRSLVRSTIESAAVGTGSAGRGVALGTSTLLGSVVGGSLTGGGGGARSMKRILSGGSPAGVTIAAGMAISSAIAPPFKTAAAAKAPGERRLE